MPDDLTLREAATRLARYLEETRPNDLASWRSTVWDMNWLATHEGDNALPPIPTGN